MAGVDVDQLLTPVSEESPSGENLEYDPTFAELERACVGEPERFSGTETIPAKEPEWKDVRRLSLELLARSKDLRVAVQLVQAETALEGIAGLSAGVSVLKGLVERFWDDVYPRLEIDGEYDPVFRINALAPLSDLNGLLGVLRRTYLVEARSVGRFTFRDLDIAEQRTAPSDGEEAPSMELLLGALTEAGEEYARTGMKSLKQASEDLQAIDKIYTERTNDGSGPDFAPLQKTLQSAIAFLAKGLPAEEGAQPTAEGDAGGAGGGTRGVTGEIRSREDVKRILGQICDFMQRSEPSNPAPLLLNRARRLLDCSFMDIIQDLAPESLPVIEKLAGTAQSQGTDASS